MLPLPAYLPKAGIQSDLIRYEWDDWKTLPQSQASDEELTGRLAKISRRAVLALMCATAEWIVYRFDPLCDDTSPWDYLEGAWAMTIDVRYCGYGSGNWWQEHAVDGWHGPVKGIIAEALERLEVAIQQLFWEGTDPVRRAGLVDALARYVMPDTAPYLEWRERIVKRFESLFPRDADDPLGDPVPREAVDPDLEFDPARSEALLRRYLAGLDHRRNIFLSSPEAMTEPDDAGESFRGVPYSFDLAVDRRMRREVEGHDHE
ncbi:hypothetical protein [Luteolibacter sp. Populi]|uniref:hypothetical protein n=1 Tax=Luteolibacter sp. Populi TaxID=3230487 RepID=UPI0034653D05